MSHSSSRLQYRWGVYKNIRAHIDNAEGGMDKFTQAYKHFGLNRGEHEGKKGIWYREWAPGAQAVALIGEFNDWNPKDDHWALKSEYGTFALFLPDVNGRPQVPHRCAAHQTGRVVGRPAVVLAADRLCELAQNQLELRMCTLHLYNTKSPASQRCRGCVHSEPPVMLRTAHS
jgi:hypothetical protein